MTEATVNQNRALSATYYSHKEDNSGSLLKEGGQYKLWSSARLRFENWIKFFIYSAGTD